MAEPSLFEDSEGAVRSAVEWLRLAIESVGALVIAAGVLIGIAMMLRSAVARRGLDFNGVRLTLARHLALALELQLAADILSTAIAPSWDRIGKLAAIAVIRTALNYFLMIEMRGEAAARPESADRSRSGPPAPHIPGPF